jgi:hypothetical protein
VSWADDFLKNQPAIDSANRASVFQEQPGFLSGFVQSAASSFGELFGQNPTEAAVQFRAEHPVAGFGSELIGFGAPYAAVFKASRIPALAGALEGAVARTGLSAVENPVAYGAVKEMLRYSPLELSRLGVGLTTGDESWGDMFADVGLSTVLNGGIGGIGGWFRRAGKVAPVTGRTVGTDLALAPTFELRAARTPGATFTGDLGPDETIKALMREAAEELPYDGAVRGGKGKFVYDLEGNDPQATKMVNGLFRAQADDAKDFTLDRRLFWEGSEKSKRTLDYGEADTLAKAAGFADQGELLETLRYPRVVTVKGQGAAGAMAKIFDDSAAVQYVENGTLLGKEKDGLWFVAKRVKSAAADAPAEGAKPPKVFGTMQSAEGDRWIIGLTDQPQRFVPKAHRLAEFNINEWSKYRSGYNAVGRDDFFNSVQNSYLSALTPQDFKALATESTQSWISRKAGELGQKIAGVTGLEHSAQWRQTAEALYDVIKPSRFKENQDSLYQRMYTLLKGTTQAADEVVNRIVTGTAELKGSPLSTFKGGQVAFKGGWEGHEAVRPLIAELSEDEVQQIALAAQTQTPAEDLAKLSIDGIISPRAAQVVAQLQEINKDFVQKIFMPTFRGTDIETNFKWLDGYLMPRVWDGPYQASIRNAAGKEVFLATGKTVPQVRAQVERVLQEAEERGFKWSGETPKLGIELEGKDTPLEAVHKLVGRNLAADRDAQEIVSSALRKLNAEKSAGGWLGFRQGKPASVAYERTSRTGSPDLRQWTKEDLVGAIENHYRQLSRYAAAYSWRMRWGNELQRLSKFNPTLHADLMRKNNQILGIAGELSRSIDRALSHVLPGIGGGKPATKFALQANKLMYAWNLGILQPTFAMLNVLQPFQTTLPRMAYMLSAPTEDVARLMQFVPRAGEDGLIRGSVGFWSPMKLITESMKLLKAPGDELRGLYSRGITDGTINGRTYEDWVGGASRVNETIKDAYKRGGMFSALGHISTTMAEKSEQLSRMHTFNAYYLLGKNHFGLEGEQLYQFTKRGVEVSMYGYSLIDRARIFTGPVGSMFGLFKNFQMHFVGDMLDFADIAINKNVWGPLVWQFAAATVIGGLGATPLKVLADGLASWHDKDSNGYLWMQEHWKGAADEIYFGLPALMGASLQASAMTPGTDVRNDVTSLTNFVFLDRALAVGKALGTAKDFADAGGGNPLNNPNIRDGLIQALSPRAFNRAFSAMEGDKIVSMSTGYPSVQNVDMVTRVAHGMGFNLVEIERYQRASNELYRKQEEERELINSMGRAWTEAEARQDYRTLQDITTRALAWQVPLSSVISSAHTIQRREQGDSLSRYGRKDQLAQRYMQALQR